jgi:hypothetical protein
VITTNIHRVKPIRLERIDFGNFISHQFTFETEDGDVEISAFASASLELAMQPTRASSVDADDVQAVGAQA